MSDSPIREHIYPLPIRSYSPKSLFELASCAVNKDLIVNVLDNQHRWENSNQHSLHVEKIRLVELVNRLQEKYGFWCDETHSKRNGN